MNIKLTNIILSFLLVIVCLKGEETQISLDNLDAFFLKGVDNRIYTKSDINGENGNLIVFSYQTTAKFRNYFKKHLSPTTKMEI